jgi:mono/diheme cytochrome c family protein
MSRRVAVPLAAGLATAVVVFLVVFIATRGDEEVSSGPTPAARAAGRPDPAGGRLVFAQMGCGGCHTLRAAGSKGEIGPSLDAALPRHTRGSVQAKIVNPGTGSVMPQDFAQRMSFADLQALVDFLMAARGGGAAAS